MSNEQGRPRPVEDPRRKIEDFMVFSSAAGWRAVHTADPTLVVEAPDWDRLDLYCTAQRIGLRLRREVDELSSWGRWGESAP